jgi:hypothetical protein
MTKVEGGQWLGQYQGRIRFGGDRRDYRAAKQALELKAAWLLDMAGRFSDPYSSADERATYANRAARWTRAAGRVYALDLAAAPGRGTA